MIIERCKRDCLLRSRAVLLFLRDPLRFVFSDRVGGVNIDVAISVAGKTSPIGSDFNSPE